MLMDTIVLIPAYQPDRKLITTLKELVERGLPALVVDDGSGSEYDAVFIEAGKYARIVRYARNRGKGGALKQGISCIRKCFPNCRYMITADADGQHAPADILRLSEKLAEGKTRLVIGSRQFVGDVPLRSRFGNSITRHIYSLVSGVKVEDTQTGLRGFDASLFDWLLRIPGERYEYEMNVLMSAARDEIEIDELPIETIYEHNNSSSHFDPIKDSVKIYKEIFKFALGGIVKNKHTFER